MIPIKNIYYMLSYVWKILKSDTYKKVQTEEFENINDMFGAILALGIKSQIKRGLNKQYINIIEPVSVLRGRIELSQSIRENIFIKQKLICSFDDFTSNTYMNQILKSTSILLLKDKNLNKDVRSDLNKVLVYFKNIDLIKLQSIQWSMLKYNRNNATYRMLMNICYLICEGLLLTEKEGKEKLANFLRNKAMSALYEKFVLEFYKKEIPELNAASSYIDWIVDDGVIDLLPKMHTDITLTNRDKERLIIDTKYYPEAMQKNYLNDNRTLISGNLYQIFAYVKNSDFIGSVSGMLLYPTVGYDLDEAFCMSGNKIYIKTLNLDCKFGLIKEQLVDIAKLIL